MKRIHLLPNALTAFSLSCGLFVIFKMGLTLPQEVTYSLLLQASALLLLAAVADLLDGAVARAMKAESNFGGFFDSMSDGISFGVAPAIMVLKTLSIELDSPESFLITLGAMIFSICGVLRLVRFNVISLTLPNEPDSKAPGNYSFIGLPIPAGASLIISSNLFFLSPDAELLGLSNLWWRPYFMALLFLAVGYLMVSRLRFPSFKNFRIRIASFQVILLSSILIMLLFFGLLHHFSLVFLLLAWIYLIGSLLLSLYRTLSGKSTKNLSN